VQVKMLNILTGEHRTGEFPKINPRTIVPTIVDDEFVLCESKAILMYLPHKMGMCKGRAFYPKCAKTRALVNQRLLFDSCDFYSIISEIIGMSFGDEPILNVHHKASLLKALGTMETTFLEGNEFFVGQNPTIADFAFCSSVAMLIALGFNLDDFPNITAWLERMETLKGFNELKAGAQQMGNIVTGKLKNSFSDL
jgi:glutathione S-transferase